MSQELLIDNDALLKLARYGLIHESISAINVNPGEVITLATAKYSLLPYKNRLRTCRDEETATRLENFLKMSMPLNADIINSDFLDKLSSSQNIDAGEALLLAAGATNQDMLLLTGDKRALAALSNDTSISEIAEMLSGRVISMEILFLLLLNNCQFEYIQKCVKSKPDVDKALSIVFGISLYTDLEETKKALTSYVNHLQGLTGKLLYRPSMF